MKYLSVLLLFALITLGLNAEIKLPALFTNNMVLQQQSEAPIWGKATPKSEVKIVTSWNNESYSVAADKNGEWIVKVKTPAYGGPYTVVISDETTVELQNVMIGEVWLCAGQSNMEMPMKGFSGQPVEGSNMDILRSRNSNIRVIDVPRKSTVTPVNDFEGQWNEASPEVIRNFSATGYYFGRLLNEMLDIPVGLISVNYGGSCIQAWMSTQTATPFEGAEMPKRDEDIKVKNRTPSVLFNGMLNPVIGYGIKGCIYYQGETNYVEPDAYEELLPTMVNEWRTLWGQGEFPFYYAQIAPFDYSVFTPTEFHEKYNSAYLRDAQRKAQAKIPNSGMIVLMDVGSKTGIHPKEKKVGGERFALYALGDTYKKDGFSFKSPSFNAIEIKGSSIVVSFNDAPMGLTSFDQEVIGFEIAGENKVFYPATAWLRSKSVVLSSPRVEKPVAVRYCFKDFTVGTLFGTDGLPVSSFRTDEW